MNEQLKQDLIDFLQNELRNCDDDNERADEIDKLLGRLQEI
jgi:hypothetical protein